MTKYHGSTKYEFRQNIQPKIAPLTAAVSGALAAGSLQAATITVDTLNDGFNTGECTLRSALYSSILNVNYYGCVAGEAGADSIVFASGLTGTITLGTSGFYYDGSTLPIGESVSIDGDNEITIQGTGNAPVFYALYDDTAAYNADIVQIAQVTITGGGGVRGGGILSRANSLQLADVTIDANTATEAGGGVWHEPYTGSGELLIFASEITGNTVTGTNGYGGGIGVRMPSQSDIQISGANFYGNAVANGGGGGLHLELSDYAYVDIKYSNFENNAAKYGNGGGIQANLGYARVDLSDNTFTGNNAFYGGGGLYLAEGLSAFQRAEITLETNEFSNNSAGTTGGGASINLRYGGAGTIAQPNKFVDFSGDHVFYSNDAAAGGGGLYLNLDDTVTAAVNGAVFNGNYAETVGGGGLLAEVNASQISTQDSTFVGNNAAGGEGGAVNATVTDGSFYGNGVFATGNQSQAGGAGGVQVTANNSDFGIEYSTFYSNTATGCGGGLRLTGTPNEAGIGHSVFVGNSASCGGAVSLFAPAASNVLVEVKYNEMSLNDATSNSTVTGGGAIFAEFGTSSSVVVKNSTISGNTSAGMAGGVRLRGDMSAEVKYATVANNYAYDYGGGIYNDLSSCNISNTILGGNTNQTGSYQDLRGTQDCTVSDSLLAGAKYSTYADGGGNIVNVAPELEALADNGGNAGWTHALQAGSPALDAGNAGSYAPDYDQRGPAFPRVQGAAMDMGALEVGPAVDVLFQDRFEQP